LYDALEVVIRKTPSIEIYRKIIPCYDGSTIDIRIGNGIYAIQRAIEYLASI
jgi:hypothetical protein